MIDIKKFKPTPKNITYIAFVVIELAIYITFNILSATMPQDPIYLKYAGVLLCLAVSGAAIYFTKSKDAVILTCAFVFTAISDLFILVLDDYYQIGLVTFMATQSVYLYRLYKDRLNKLYITVIVRALLAALLLAAVDVIAGLNFMLVEVCIYIVMLAGNVIDAFLLIKRGAKNIIFAVGLLLFLCCDICVGLDNAQGIIGLSLGGAATPIQFLIWVFYLPSQVLIACSVNDRGMCPALKSADKDEIDNDEGKEQKGA